MHRLNRYIAWLAAAFFLLGPALAHFEAVPPITGFAIFALGGLAGLMASVLGIANVIRTGVGNRNADWLGILPAFAVTGLFLWSAIAGLGVPRINDITTDGVRPPTFERVTLFPENRQRNMSYPGAEFFDQQKQAYPDIQPFLMAIPQKAAFERVRAAAHSMPGWVIVREDVGHSVIEGYDTSWLFRFKDDFVIEVRSDGTGSVVHMRSKSRDGKGDLGANAARIRRFFEKLR